MTASQPDRTANQRESPGNVPGFFASTLALFVANGYTVPMTTSQAPYCWNCGKRHSGANVLGLMPGCSADSVRSGSQMIGTVIRHQSTATVDILDADGNLVFSAELANVAAIADDDLVSTAILVAFCKIHQPTEDRFGNSCDERGCRICNATSDERCALDWWESGEDLPFDPADDNEVADILREVGA